MRRRQGPDRPINRLEDRAQVLAGLSSVDHLAAFDETTASDLVAPCARTCTSRAATTRAMIPEAPYVEAYGGTVRILPYLEDLSTVALIQRIRSEGGQLRPDDVAAVEVER